MRTVTRATRQAAPADACHQLNTVSTDPHTPHVYAVSMLWHTSSALYQARWPAALSADTPDEGLWERDAVAADGAVQEQDLTGGLLRRLPGTGRAVLAPQPSTLHGDCMYAVRPTDAHACGAVEQACCEQATPRQHGSSPHELLCQECDVPRELIGELHVKLQLDVDLRNRHVGHLQARPWSCMDAQPDCAACMRMTATSGACRQQRNRDGIVSTASPKEASTWAYTPWSPSRQ